MAFFGTTLFAAPVLGLIAAAVPGFGMGRLRRVEGRWCRSRWPPT